MSCKNSMSHRETKEMHIHDHSIKDVVKIFAQNPSIFMPFLKGPRFCCIFVHSFINAEHLHENS